MSSGNDTWNKVEHSILYTFVYTHVYIYKYKYTYVNIRVYIYFHVYTFSTFVSTPPGVHNYTLRYRSFEKQTRRTSQRYVVPQAPWGRGRVRSPSTFLCPECLRWWSSSTILCVWGWLLRGPHPKGTTIFPKTILENLPSLKLTASLHLKMDGWNMKFPFPKAHFQGLYVSFTEDIF